MNLLLLLVAGVCIVAGLAGCVLPLLPGPPLSFLGLWLLHFTRYASWSTEFLLLLAGLAVTATVLDYAAPAWTTKRFGGSRAGIRGATLGLLVGILFFPPLGVVLGPLLGAVAGELLHGADSRKAFKAGLGSFAGFFLGMGLKLAVSMVITYYFVKAFV